MHTDLKIQSLIAKHGLEGYAIWVLCLELLGKEGKRGLLNSKSGWQNGLVKVAGWSDNGKLTKILESMAELKLINSKSLKYGNLYIPKFTKRADDYTLRMLRIETEQNTTNVLVDKIRLDKIRLDKIRLDKIIHTLIERKNWDKNNKPLLDSIYKRHSKPAKELLLLINNDDYVIRAVKWVADVCKNKGLNWTLETVISWLPEFMKQYPPKDNTPQAVKDLTKGIGK